MQTFSVKQLVCKILKTKNCVPFELQYYSNNQGDSNSEAIICFFTKFKLSADRTQLLTVITVWDLL